MRNLDYEIGSACIWPNKEYRCVEAISGLGIEVGDRCILKNGFYVPVVRYCGEGGGESKPFNRLSVDIEGFKYVTQD